MKNMKGFNVDWYYHSSIIKEPVGSYYGFIYKLTFETKDTKEEKYYIGKKAFYSFRELPMLKNGKKRNGHIKFLPRKKKELVKKESDWKTYEGSYKGDRTNLVLKEKRILCFARTKRELTYLETKYLFLYEVLERDEFLNENILNKFFKGNLV